MRKVLLSGLAAACAATAGVTAPQVVPAVPSAKELGGPFGAGDVTAFNAPPKVFYPETWFHFLGGNIATGGITADLTAIAEAGLSGVQLFHGQLGKPYPGVEPQIACLSEPWDQAVRHAAEECRRLGLRFTMQNCPGWSMAGGPWIAPSNAMRHLVWSRTDVTTGDGAPVTAALPHPQPGTEPWRDYRDIAVLAFPTPLDDTGLPLKPSAIRSNREGLPWTECLDGDAMDKLSLMPSAKDAPAWVEVAFPQDVMLRTVEFSCVQAFNHAWCYAPGVTVTVQALYPGRTQDILRVEMPQSNWQDDRPITLACDDTSASCFRILIENKYEMKLNAIRLFSAARKNSWESEAAWTLRGIERSGAAPRQSADAFINPSGIRDISAHMDAQGRLAWDAPQGRWTVLRIGHVNAGRRNGPAPGSGSGWECDKLSPTGADAHFAGYIGRLTGADGPLTGGLLNGILLDSWECKTQTWTPAMEAEFRRVSGYPLREWMPALFGYVIAGHEETARFLRDWRATINDLFVNSFYGRMAELAHGRGLSIAYETAAGDVFPADILEYYKHADVPMCEFWQPHSGKFVGSLNFKPIKPCASAARIYGKPRVAAEAFTSFSLTWNERFEMLKEVANIHLAEGVTHLVFHTYAHNPRTDALPPGAALAATIGTPFLRGQTWWRHMPELTGYLARCGYLLERGKPVSDVLWYLGDDFDHKPDQEAPFPRGYKYDYCNADALMNRLSVKNNMLVTPEGIRYRVLWLPENTFLLPRTQEKISQLRRKGVKVLSPPGGFAALGRELTALGLPPDVTGDGALWTHRQADGADWYFVCPEEGRAFKGVLGFRCAGDVEIWHPVDGSVKPAAARRAESRTFVWLDLPRAGSCFVVFRQARKPAATIVRVEHNGTPVIDTHLAATPTDDIAALIAEARYGDLTQEGRWIDVTAKVRALYAKGTTLIPVGNGLANHDPAPQTVKQLDVRLRYPDNRMEHITAKEGGVAKLPPRLPPPPAACEVAGDGKKIVAWMPGTYRVTCSDKKTRTVEAREPLTVALTAPWTFAFPEGWGAPPSLRITELKAWKDLDLPPEAQAFSGTVTYTTTFDAGQIKPRMRFMLDLGRVDMIASVTLNGKKIGTVWADPYRLDITGAITSGANTLTAEVTSTWFNRLVYDAGFPEAERKTWTVGGPDKNATRVPSGLLGPVSIRMGEEI